MDTLEYGDRLSLGDLDVRGWSMMLLQVIVFSEVVLGLVSHWNR